MAKSKKPHSETWWRVLAVSECGTHAKLTIDRLRSRREATQSPKWKRAFSNAGWKYRVVQVRETVIEKRKATR